VVDKGQLKKLIAWLYALWHCQNCERLTDSKNWIRYATKAGISISVDDLMIPPKKALSSSGSGNRDTETRYTRGEITEERFQVIDTWTLEALKDEVDHFKASDPLNSVYMMALVVLEAIS